MNSILHSLKKLFNDDSINNLISYENFNSLQSFEETKDLYFI